MGITWEHFARNCNAFELFGLGIMHSMCMCMLSGGEFAIHAFDVVKASDSKVFHPHTMHGRHSPLPPLFHPSATSPTAPFFIMLIYMSGKLLAETIPIEMLLAMWCENQAIISVPAHTHCSFVWIYGSHLPIWAFARPSSTGSYCFQRTSIHILPGWKY